MDSVMRKSSLLPGFRFNPTDVELVQYYLKSKVMGKRLDIEVIAEVDISKWDPWDLPDKSHSQSGDLKWYFFCPREKKYASGARLNRATNRGFWKITGKERSVNYNGEVVGWIRTLVFYTGKVRRGERTNWVIHEYRLEDKKLVDMGVPQDSYVLCMVFQKDGIGQYKQYGAPFKEEDWTDDEIETDVVPHVHTSEPEPDIIHLNMPEPDLVQANIPDQVVVNTNITEPDLVYGNMPDPYLGYPKMPQSDLGYSNMPQSDLGYANISEPYLSGGFRFNPTDVELVQYYLKRKVMGKRLGVEVIAEVDIYKWDPWDLPDKSHSQSGDLKWYFFCPREKKYASGARLNRATNRGFWKITGKERSVNYNGEVVGWIRTLVFYTGKVRRGERTNWVIHEYRLEDKKLVDMGVPQDSYVLCMVFQKDGIGQYKQYGAPFKEEDWTDDEIETDVVPHVHTSEPEPDIIHLNMPEPDLVQANIPDQVVVNTNVTEPDLVYGNMPDPYLGYPKMPQSDLGYSNMPQSDLGYANISELYLSGGFRFNPTDVELVQYYLKRKVMGKRLGVEVIAEVDIYKWDPWDLPAKSRWRSGDLKWYFFCPRDKTYASGARMNRATNCGYWKITGKERSVIYNGEVVGWIETLVFYKGQAPRGERTNWVLHEYRLEDKKLVDMGVPQDSYVLCMVFRNDWIGPRTKKQYGAPFKEEDWTDDEVETDVVPHVDMCEPNLVHANMHEPEPDIIHLNDLVQANIPDQVLVNTNITKPNLGYRFMPYPYLVYPNMSQSDLGYSNMPQSDLGYANISEPYLSGGFRFNPTDVELVQYYLKRKVMGKRLYVEVIGEVDIYKWAPWDLPDKSRWQSGDLKWYFFCPREKKYASGARMNRATDCGYWKITGKERSVNYNGEVVGWIKTLVFYIGQAPRGERTNWVLHEYRLEDKKLVDMGVPQDSYVLCMVFRNDWIGPRTKKQYGAPFIEEDWTDDEVESDVVPHVNMSEPNLIHSNMPVSLRLIGQLPRNFLLNFKFLTALHLSRKLDFDLPSPIGDVKSLRCLDVSYTPISWLPESIGLLHKLQTLKLRSCRNLVQLPESITSLHELQTLHLRGCVNLVALPKGIKVLIKLRDLDVINCPNLKLSGEPNEKLMSSEINLSESLELKESYPNLEEKVVHEDEEYDSLPKQLKSLFLYCSLFPSHYEFRRDELVQMWIAEGLIEEIHGGVMEDIGGEYFMSLLNKGFLVPSRCDYRVDFDSVFSVPIYNPGHLLYKGNPLKFSRLGSTIAPAEYFVAVDGRLDGALEMTQRLSLICRDIDEMTFGLLKKFKHMRTLLVFAGCGSSIKYVPRDLFLSLKELRTLNLSQTLVSELPSSIRYAKSLRYLDLSNTLITRLPESIDSLHTLQTVRLRGCVHFLQLPKGMKKLINLRHIDLDIIRQLRSMPPHLGSLTNLQTLSAFLVGRDDGCRIGELKNLNDLRGVLCISRLENVSCQEEAKAAALIEKIYLQRLELRWSTVFAKNTEEQEKILECLQPHDGLKELQIQQYAGSRLPTWISNPCFAELIVLTLYRCKNCELLPSIGQLPMLKSLSLIEMNEVKEINYQFLGKKNPVDQVSHAFSKLEILEVDIMLNLKVWKDVNIGDLPSLLKLTVDSCPELTTLPSLSWLKSLMHLELRRCPKILTLPGGGLPASLESFIVIDCPELKEWCRMMEGEDWRKICHLPSIWLDCEEVSKSHSGLDHQ